MKLLSAALSAVIFLLSPGLGPISAFAGVIQSAPVAVPVAVPMPVLGVTVSGAPTLSPLSPTLAAPNIAPTLTIPTALPSARPTVAAPSAVALPGRAYAAPSALALPQAVPALASPVRAAVANAALPAAEGTPGAVPTAFQSLSNGAQSVGRAAAGSKAGVLDSFFTGARAAGAENGAVEASGAQQAGRSGLELLSIEKLSAEAVDSTKPLAERQAAVASIAKAGGEAAKAALGAVAEANPQGGADDYEVHRSALKALAEGFKDVRSLRPVSRAHADQILKGLTDKKPQLAVFDYDDTLEKLQQPATPETGKNLKAAYDAGVDVAILTDRNAIADGGVSVIDSLKGLSNEEKSALTIAARSGGEMVVYDKSGAEAILERLPAWNDAERKAVEEVSALITAKYGTAEHQGKTGGITDFTFYRLLPIGTPAAVLDEAAEFTRAELAKRGVTGLHIIARPAKNPQADPPYVQASKINKQRGIGILRGERTAYTRLQTFMGWGLPARSAAKVLGWLRRIPESKVAASRMLIVGDQFFGQRATDADMTKAASGALTLSVGGKADPRLPNIYVMPTEGHAGSMEILGALAAKPVTGFNKKAVMGLFAMRTMSIGSFVLTAIAYPFVAAPAVGWAVFGTLMALGPLAAIATGPLNGAMADKFSARGVMTMNMAIRAVLALALPIFSWFGILNFWTLLIASIANGWALSSTMTTETAYVRRLAGKHMDAVQALISVNFVALQVILGLLVGVGSMVDHFNPLYAFLASAAIHGLLALPIAWFTMPSDAPAQTGPKKPAVPLGERAKAFGARYWKEALITAAAIASFPFWHSALPIALALFYWVTRTDAVRALRAGEYREVSPREKELAQELASAEKGSPQAKALEAESKVWTRRQFAAVLHSAGQAVLTFPFQNFALPLIATLLVGTAGKGLLLGKLLGAMYFGNLIANSAQANLPELRLPLIGRFKAQRLVQGAVLAMAAAWVYTGLVPGSILAAAAAVAIAAALTKLAERFTNSGYIRLLGVGLGAVALPATVWFFPGLIPFLSVQTALFLAMLVYGLFVGPSAVSLGNYQQNNGRKSDLGKVFGVQSSFFNTFNSVGYGLMALAAAAFTPAFPMMFIPMGLLYIVGGLAFWTANRRLPGLPPTLFQPKDADK